MSPPSMPRSPKSITASALIAPARTIRRCAARLRNWWELPGVMDVCRQLFPVGEGSHATPSEVSVT